MTENGDIDLEGWDLHRAAQENRLDIARALIARGDDIEAKNVEEETPLHRALEPEKLDIARLLLDQGANVDAETWSGTTPLQEEANWGILAGPMLSPEIAHLLIEYGADTADIDLSWLNPIDWLNAIDEDRKRSNLHRTAKFDDRKGTVDGIERGWDIEAKNEEGDTPLHIAASYSSSVAEVLIVAGANVEAKNNTGDTPLHCAAKSNSFSVARLLIDRGANTEGTDLSWMDQINEDRNPPFKALLDEIIPSPHSELAWEAWRKETLELVAQGGDVETKVRFVGTLLHGAVSRNFLDVASSLIDRGADIEAKNENGWTPLHKAVRNNFLDIARLLIGSGADIEAKTENGFTPLHLASAALSLEFVRLLIEHGADIDANIGEAPLHLALNSRSGKLGRWQSELAIARLLLDHGADVDAENWNGSTPLHLAAERDAFDLAEVLIEHGANMETKNASGQTPLLAAAMNNSIDVASLLVDSGANTEGIDLSRLN